MAARLILCVILLVASAHAAEFTYTESDGSGKNIALGYPPPQPVDTTAAGDWFRSYDFLVARHQELMLDNERLRGQVAGETWSGEDIWVYRFGDLDEQQAWSGGAEGAVLINGSIHAREWQTQEATTGLMEYLVAIQDDAGIGSYLSDNLDIFIIPVHNIDGFRQTQRYWNKVTNSEDQPRDGRMRRKNLHAPDGSTVDDLLSTGGDNLYGIDLNRNSDYGFGNPAGSSNDATSLIYHGVDPASEPETKALHAVALLLPTTRWRFYEDVHSFSQLMYVPQIGDTRRDAFARSLAANMSDAVGGRYFVSPDPVDGSIGTTADYFGYRYKVPAWTLELEPRYQKGGTQYDGIGVSHDGFILPESEVSRLRDEFNRMHLRVFYEMAAPTSIRQVAIRRVADNEIVYSAQWDASGNARVLNVSVDETLQPATEYEIRVGFNKPVRSDVVTGINSIMLADSAGNQENLTTSVEWLSEPGGGFDGYDRYRHDAYRATFELPASLPADPERRMLLIDVQDFGKQKLDPDPATIPAFVDGKWIGFERNPGVVNDGTEYGNADCNIMISVADGSSDVAPEGDAGECQALLAPDDPPPAPPPAGGGGGGGAMLWWLLMFAVSLRSRRARTAHA